MKNREKFAKEILDVACKGDSFMVTKSGEITFCDRFKCDMCKFNDSTGEKSCRIKRYEWSKYKYIENHPTITSKEKNFLDVLLPECKYIARETSDSLYVYYQKPTRNHRSGTWESDDDFRYLPKSMYGDIFSFIKGDDKQPWSIEDLKKLEVKDE